MILDLMDSRGLACALGMLARSESWSLQGRSVTLRRLMGASVVSGNALMLRAQRAVRCL